MRQSLLDLRIEEARMAINRNVFKSKWGIYVLPASIFRLFLAILSEKGTKEEDQLWQEYVTGKTCIL